MVETFVGNNPHYSESERLQAPNAECPRSTFGGMGNEPMQYLFLLYMPRSSDDHYFVFIFPYIIEIHVLTSIFPKIKSKINLVQTRYHVLG